MTDLTPERRAELRELLDSTGYDNSEPLRDWMMGHLAGRTHAATVDGAVNALPALLDAADERDRLAAAVNGLMSSSTARDGARVALIAAVERVRVLHERDGEGFCVVCDYMTPHPCPTLRAMDDRDE